MDAGNGVADQPQPFAAAYAGFAGVQREKERAAGVATAAGTLVFRSVDGVVAAPERDAAVLGAGHLERVIVDADPATGVERHRQRGVDQFFRQTGQIRFGTVHDEGHGFRQLGAEYFARTEPQGFRRQARQQRQHDGTDEDDLTHGVFVKTPGLTARGRTRSISESPRRR